MATYTSQFYDEGPKLRAASEQPQWVRLTHKLPAGTAYASADVINFALLGGNQSIMAYTVSTNASIAAATNNSLLKIASTSLAGNIADFGGADALVGGFCSGDSNISADGDALSLTLGTLDTAVSTGERSITLTVLLAQQESRALVEGGSKVVYENHYATP